MPRLVNPNPIGDPPEPMWFRTAYFKARTVFPLQRQPYGKLLYAVSGIVEFDIDGVRYLSPPAYAIWIPPGVAHASVARQDIYYTAVYFKNDLCGDLPGAPCTLALSAVVKAIVADFAERGIGKPESVEDQRMARVVLDQLRCARRYDSYLPATQDDLLKRLMAALQAAPHDRRSLVEWAREFGTTERTLSRRFREHLGISFSDWRQRLKFVTALSLLEEGLSVQAISHRLGYGNPSAFIAMFRQLAGVCPTQMRERVGHDSGMAVAAGRPQIGGG